MPASIDQIKSENLNSSDISIAVPIPVPATSKSCSFDLNSHLNLLQVARNHNDRRIVSRILQHLPTIRRKLTANILINLLNNSSISGNNFVITIINILIYWIFLSL